MEMEKGLELINGVVAFIKEETGEDVEVNTLAYQPLLWDGYTEARCYCKDGRVFSSLYDGDQKVTSWSEIPKKQEGLK